MNCGEAIDRSPKHVLPSDTARDTARRMRDENLSFLPVCDATGHPIGGISDRDMALRLIAEDHPATTHVFEVMDRNYPTARETDELTQTVARAHERPVIVTDAGGKLRGVIMPGRSSAPHRAHESRDAR